MREFDPSKTGWKRGFGAKKRFQDGFQVNRTGFGGSEDEKRGLEIGFERSANGFEPFQMGSNDPGKGSNPSQEGSNASEKGLNAFQKGSNASGEGSNVARKGSNDSGKGSNDSQRRCSSLSTLLTTKHYRLTT